MKKLPLRLLTSVLTIVAVAIVADVLGRIDPGAATVAFWVAGATVVMQWAYPDRVRI
jgi:hypothetical protein